MATRIAQSVRATEFFARMRRERPEIAEAEQALGSRLPVSRNVRHLRIRDGLRNPNWPGVWG